MSDLTNRRPNHYERIGLLMLLNKTRMPFRTASAIIITMVVLATIIGCSVTTTTSDIVIVNVEDVIVIVEGNEVDLETPCHK